MLHGFAVSRAGCDSDEAGAETGRHDAGGEAFHECFVSQVPAVTTFG